MLLIEDHPVLRQLASLSLEPLALTLHACESVAAARQWMAIHGAPDLLLTDLMMPGETGLEFIAALRSGADWERTLPVVVMTAGTDARQMQELDGLRLVAVLVKPVAMDTLLDTVACALRAPAHVPRIEALRTRFGGDRSLYDVFVAGCLAQFPVDVRDIDAACDAGDWATVQHVSHSLKSVFALLREDVACELARRIEQAATDGAVVDAKVIWSVLRAWLLWFVGSAAATLPGVAAPSLHLPRH